MKHREAATVAPTEGQRVYPPQRPRLYLELSVFWFAHALLWGSLISIVMQNRVKAMTGEHKDIYLSFTLAAGAIISTVVCLVVGTWSDHYRSRLGKRRPFIIAGTLLGLPAILLLPEAQTIGWLIVAFCGIQFLVNITTAPAQALVPDMVPKSHQGAASAFMGMAGLLGTLGSLALCGTLISRPHGLHYSMWIFAAVLFGAMLFTLVRIRETPAVAIATDQPPSLGQIVGGIFSVKPRDHPDFFWLIASRFCINVGFYSVTEYLAYYVSDSLKAPDPEATTAQLMLISLVSGLLGNFPAGIVSDRMSKKTVVYIANATTGVAALVFMLAPSINVAMGAAFVFGAGYGAFQAVDWALCTNLLPDKDEAKFMGLWQAAFTLPQVVAPLVAGPLAWYFNQNYGHGLGYRVVLFMVLVYLTAGTLMIRPIRERKV